MSISGAQEGGQLRLAVNLLKEESLNMLREGAEEGWKFDWECERKAEGERSGGRGGRQGVGSRVEGCQQEVSGRQ